MSALLYVFYGEMFVVVIIEQHCFLDVVLHVVIAGVGEEWGQRVHSPLHKFKHEAKVWFGPRTNLMYFSPLKFTFLPSYI